MERTLSSHGGEEEVASQGPSNKQKIDPMTEGSGTPATPNTKETTKETSPTTHPGFFQPPHEVLVEPPVAPVQGAGHNPHQRYIMLKTSGWDPYKSVTLDPVNGTRPVIPELQSSFNE